MGYDAAEFDRCWSNGTSIYATLENWASRVPPFKFTEGHRSKVTRIDRVPYSSDP